MLSICIPIYNRDLRATVRELNAQARTLDMECEVVCVDDGSDGAYAEANAPLADICRYVRLEQNVGRARVRNLFLAYAKYDYLLFLDCDSVVPEGFLRRYAAALEGKPMVMCGGRVYDTKDNDRRHRLRYKYGVRCESRRVEERVRQPYKSFMTNNFVVHREVLERVPFDERIARYGHEDTLWGYRLMQEGVVVTHMDNPVINGDVEENEEFLRKTQEGVKSLAEIYRWMEGDRAFAQQVSLLDFYCKLKHWRLDGVAKAVWDMTRGVMEKGFRSGRWVSMKAFAFYKLGLFVAMSKEVAESEGGGGEGEACTGKGKKAS